MNQQPPEGLSSRERILWAAAKMLGEKPGAALSVRAVAARADVSTGSLRHHFPTQRALMDAVLAVVYDMVLPQESIHDSSIPAADRLIACLQRLLAPEGAKTSPREAWILAFDRYIRPEPTPEVREEALALEREMLRRIEYCLSVLQNEGAIEAGDNTRRAKFLMTVVSGLSIAQALPAESSRLQDEHDALRTAVDSIVKTAK
ncbi:TetR/AcrR family transcriptional regulator [Saccharopolyspora indica]|uniref:TetR/AcrR family transcriptional regulator n=1 Tax=Saccharopolyspora indica TaxID=1229659 RepID=UPI0022EB6E35|nr:TetR/AcrR family transcriptional regulator [Saccharopolyspora indica]MDA3650065.1 TetR/AcrR family transcriptional regulator [Saccharopolyspora indica]